MQLRRGRIANSVSMFFDMRLLGCMFEGKEVDMLRKGYVAKGGRTHDRVLSPGGTKFARVEF